MTGIPMDPLPAALAASSVALEIFAIAFGLRARRPALALTAGVALAGILWWIYSTTFPPATIRSRGDAETAALVVSYVSMVLGMVAHYVYAKAERGEKSLSIEWLPFLMPILASPIVFVPLVSMAGAVGTDGRLFSQARVMVYLVAFQNGFFWKHFFDQQRALSTTHAAPQA